MFIPMKDSSQTIVKEAEEKKEVVKAGEDNEKVVEGVLHIIRGKDED